MNIGPVKKREIFGWVMYDFANSSYTTVVTTAIYAGFFTEYIVPKDSAYRDSYWSIAIIIATLIALVLSPLVGAVCDLSGKKKRYLFACTICCALPCALLYFVDPGEVWLAIFLLSISNAAFMLSENFCGSFLTELASKKNMAFISGLGWGFGYIGGVAALAICLVVITGKPEQEILTFISQNQLAMFFCGLFFLISALPTFILVRERATVKPGFDNYKYLELLREGWRNNLGTLIQERQKHKDLFRFLLAFLFYYAGLSGVISFAGIFARRELGFGMDELTIMFMVIQVSSLLGSIFFGYIEKFTGLKKNLMITLFIWVLSLTGIALLDVAAESFNVSKNTLFYVVSLLVGTGIGSTQSASRAVVGIMAPAEKSAEMFGVWGLYSRLAVLLAMFFGFISDASSLAVATTFLIGCILMGAFILKDVPISKYAEN